MRSLKATVTSLALAVLACGLLTGCAEEISADKLAQKIGQPGDTRFFGDQAVYMGDKDGYRYVHVRDLYDSSRLSQDQDFKVPQSQWPMLHPMPLTCDASQWQNVQWLNGDAPSSIPQDASLAITPTFPLGAPKTQPATRTTHPTTGTEPATTPSSAPATTQPPTTQPATQG